jgi:hypothetical protein
VPNTTGTALTIKGVNFGSTTPTVGDAQLCWVNPLGRPETVIVEESGI